MINQVRLLTCRLRIWIRIQRSWHINHLQKPDEADLSYRPYYLVERRMYLTEKGCHLTWRGGQQIERWYSDHLRHERGARANGRAFSP